MRAAHIRDRQGLRRPPLAASWSAALPRTPLHEPQLTLRIAIHADRRLPRIRLLVHQRRPQIAPLPVQPFDERELPLAPPALDQFLPVDRFGHVPMPLEPDQLLAAPLARK